jgi:uncharacterized protein
MTDLTLAVLLGLAIGFALGAFGGGGSILAVPALVYGLGVSVRQAIPTALLVVALTATAASIAHLRASRVDLAIAARFAAGGVVGSFIGAWVHHLLPEPAILGGLAVVMIAASLGMWRRGRRKADEPAVGPEGSGRVKTRVLFVVIAGASVGLLTGAFGVGGGFLVVPTLALVLGVPTPMAVGTSLVVIAVTALAGLAAHLRLGDVDLALTGAFAAGGLVGAVTGQCTSQRLSSGALASGFALVVAGVGILMLMEVVFA